MGASLLSDRDKHSTKKTLRLRRAMISLSVLVLFVLTVLVMVSFFAGEGAKKSSRPPSTVVVISEGVLSQKEAAAESAEALRQAEQTKATADEAAAKLAALSPELASTSQALALQAAVDEARAIGPDSGPTLASVAATDQALADASAALDQKIAGYDALMAEIEQVGSGGRVAVAVLDAATGAPLVRVNSDEVFTAASTIKIATATSMMNAVEDGSWGWGSTLNGTTLEYCMEVMIVESDNDCPFAWYSAVGLGNVEEVVRSAGGTSTTLAPGDLRTTAMDLALLLQSIESGEAMNDENKQHLLGLMARQNYRDGIPAGLGADAVVQDKVGFLDGLLHDAGIIRTEKGDYVVVVLTEYRSWEAIAKITEAIYEYL